MAASALARITNGPGPAPYPRAVVISPRWAVLARLGTVSYTLDGAGGHCDAWLFLAGCRSRDGLPQSFCQRDQFLCKLTPVHRCCDRGLPEAAVRRRPEAVRGRRAERGSRGSAHAWIHVPRRERDQ